MAPPSAVVIGAGPAGSLMSIILANRGYHVDLVERIPDFNALSEKKTFVYVLTARALKAINYAGLELSEEVALCLKGASFHKNGSVFSRQYDSKNPKYSVGRTDLAKYLLKEVESHKSGNIKVHLGWTLYALEDEGEVARFRRTRSKTEEVEKQLSSGSPLLQEGPEQHLDLKDYDLLVGADGANSVTRAEMVRLDAEKGGPKQERLTFFQKINSSKYKRLPPLSREQFLQSFMAPYPDQVHYCLGKSGASILGAVKADGCYYATFIFPKNKQLRALDLSDKEVVASFMEREFPEFLKLFTQDDPKFLDSLVKEPLLDGGISTYCSRYHSGKVVLIGDAAHSMYPTFGQGCNSALEDCYLLDQILDMCAKDGEKADKGKEFIPKVLSLFSEQRKPDMDAIVEVSEDCSSPAGARSMMTLFQLTFRLSVLSLAGKVVPTWGPKQVVVDDIRPFSEFKNELERENRRALVIFSGSVLCLGLASLAGSAIYRAAKKGK